MTGGLSILKTVERHSTGSNPDLASLWTNVT